MKIRSHRDSGRPKFFIMRQAKLLWCRKFHRQWRRRVAILPDQASGLGYKVQCPKCGMRDIEITEFQETTVSG